MEKPPIVAPPIDPAQAQGTWVLVTLREGRKRQIRRMAAAEKLGVRRLIRIGMGPLKLDRKLRPGQSRPLTSTELRQIQEPVSERSSRAPRRPAPGRDASSAIRRSSSDRPAEPGRSVPSDRGPGRPYPPSDRGAGPDRRPEPSDRGPGRPYTPSDRGAGPNRRPAPSDRGPGPDRRPAPSGRGPRPSRPTPRSDRDTESGPGRQPAGRAGPLGRQRGPGEAGPGPHRPGGRETQPARQDRSERRDRPGPAADTTGRPERRQSPLGFQKPPRPAQGTRPGGYERDSRGEHPRPKTGSDKPVDRRQSAEQTKRRKQGPGGPPKSRKP